MVTDLAKQWRSREWRSLNPEKFKQYQAEYRNRNLGKIKSGQRWSGLRNRYGITPEAYDGFMLLQDGVCAVCKDPNARSQAGGDTLDVDHDHKTGEVRGLLCGWCNRALGLLKDDPERLQRAIEYLGGPK